MTAVVDLRAARTGQEQRLVDATLRCIARWGAAKTSLDDVAREARCSRATVYRLFPGGKEALLDAVARHEVVSFLDRLGASLEGATDLEDALTTGITEAGRLFAGHDALRFLLAYEPEVILPRLCFGPMDEVLAEVVAFAVPHLAQWLPADDAAQAAEWAARITFSYAMCPAAEVDLADEASVRRLVRAFVLPAFTTLRG